MFGHRPPNDGVICRQTHDKHTCLYHQNISESPMETGQLPMKTKFSQIPKPLAHYKYKVQRFDLSYVIFVSASEITRWRF
jgi:hypothetical protein